MAGGERNAPLELNGNGYTTVQNFTSDVIAREDELLDAINTKMSGGIGMVQVAPGYEYVGADGGGEILGLHGHVTRDGVGIPVRVVNAGASAKIQYWDGNSWEDSNITNLDPDNKCFFTSFLNKIWMVNGVSSLHSDDGQTWVSTLFTGNTLTPIFIGHYGVRIIVMDKSNINWSSLPSDDLTSISWNERFNAVPETDDGDSLVAGIKLGGNWIAFKNYSIHRLNLSGDLSFTLDTVDQRIGLSSPRAMVEYKGYVYFYGVSRKGEKGMYRTDGYSIQRISRNVKKWFDAIPGVNEKDIAFEEKDGTIKAYVGSTDIPHCEIRFTPDDFCWERRSLYNPVRVYSGCKFGDDNDLYFGSDNGYVYRDDYGTVFKIDPSTTKEIKMRIVTHFLSIGGITLLTLLREIFISGEGLPLIKVRFRADDSEEWTPLNNTLEYKDLFKDFSNQWVKRFQLEISSLKYGAIIKKILLLVNEESQAL